MTQEEKELRLQYLNEQQFKLKKEIERGDEHATKCVKMGISYKEEYPEEYDDYIIALEQYNSNEEELKKIKKIEVEYKENIN